ncbi:MAG: DNA repair protein RecO [Sandaracinaceae bacterium]
MARTERTRAILLRSVAYGESDRIVTLLTEAHGKVGLMARGARKSQRRFAGALEPYALLDAELALGRTGLGRLAEARVIRAFPGILASLRRTFVAAAGLELLRECVGEREPLDPRLMESAVRFFELAEAHEHDALRIAFTMRALGSVGLAPNLESCASCGRGVPSGQAALFDPARGSVVCRACGGAPIKLRGGVREALLRAGTRAWDEVVTDEDRDAIAEEGARALEPFLAHHLSRPLSGPDALAQVRAHATGAGG